MLLAITYGGVLLGIGVGLVLKGGGCLDGTEVVAVILNRNLYERPGAGIQQQKGHHLLRRYKSGNLRAKEPFKRIPR